ncbi:patatin-like phospholipase family protein [Sharpea azabuensis]|uniref:patatin-like phospholipase family protein n=1 Tax=Sharpea azabuensis TaxID=322505 RepID=UPI00240A1192|nr:patatin family protein [Sharpea azabuensis]MDD6512636.1 patatin family protein [Sharpea azabuensis]
MRAIIDVGGGLRGIYGAGVLDYCIDHHLEFDECIGVSAGSANMASYIAKQKGRNYPFYLDYSFRKSYMSLENIFKKKSYLDLRYVYEALSNEGGENPLDYDAFIASNKKFIAVGYDADHAQLHYFTKEDMGRNQYQVLEASCCLPVVCQSVEIDGIHYYDGGLADPVPVQKALDDGCDEVVLILTRPLEKRENNKQDIMTAKILSKFDELAAKNLLKRADRYNQGVEIVKELEKQGKGLIVAPDTIGDMSTLTKDKEKLYLLYIKGYTDGEKIKKFLERNS